MKTNNRETTILLYSFKYFGFRIYQKDVKYMDLAVHGKLVPCYTQKIYCGITVFGKTFNIKLWGYKDVESG